MQELLNRNTIKMRISQAEILNLYQEIIQKPLLSYLTRNNNASNLHRGGFPTKRDERFT